MQQSTKLLAELWSSEIYLEKKTLQNFEKVFFMEIVVNFFEVKVECTENG